MVSCLKRKCQRVDLIRFEKKKICEVHQKHLSLTNSQLVEFMVVHYGFSIS